MIAFRKSGLAVVLSREKSAFQHCAGDDANACLVSLFEYLSVALAKDAVDKLQGIDFSIIDVLVKGLSRILRDILHFYVYPAVSDVAFLLQLLYL